MSLSSCFPQNLSTSASLSFSDMDYSWLLKLALNCFDHLAWPLLALGHPLCASVQAIETDSYSETRDLISYWILLSLIYLFEYAFLSLLSWFQFWPYIKLMIIFWLITPDFGRASYVYNNLIHSFSGMNPQAFISRLKNWRKLFVKKENCLRHTERYIQENGTEALEKLIASKITTHNAGAEATNTTRATDKKETQQITTHNISAEATNTIRATDKKKEYHAQTSGKKIQMEHKDIKDVEVIEKVEISAGKKDIPIMPNASLNQSISSPMKETNGMAKKDAGGGELPQSSPHKEVQKQWACALCQVTTTSETTLIIHQNGKKHKATCKVLKAKNQPAPEKLKNDQSKVELKQKNTISQPSNVDRKNIRSSRVKEQAQTSREPEKSVLNDPVKQENKSTHDQMGVMMNNSKLRCEACDVTCTSEVDLASHLKGRRHLDQISMLNNSKFRCEACDVTCTSEVDLASHLKGRRHLDQISMLNNSKFRCEACDVTCTSLVHLASHLQGRRHLAQIQNCSEAQLS